MKPAQDTLREAILRESMRIIEADGIQNLSMREVARRLGISHQAPYKHFASRDHILAEILRRLFAEFARHLDARARSADPHKDLESMGLAYLRYAADHPLQYRLMFGTPLPDPNEHPAMMENAQHAFALLRTAIADMKLPTSPDMDALFVWSTMHGLASILHLQMFDRLSVSSVPVQAMVSHVLSRISDGLERPTDADAPL